MRLSNNRLPGGSTTQTIWTWGALVVVALMLSACSGGSSTTAGNDPVPPSATACDPDDPSTAAECGTLILGLTDADGDFASYTVDIVSLKLEKANGAMVETLPNRTRVDFTQYVDLTEFVTAASVPPGVYVAGHITLDYSDADINVEIGDGTKPAVVYGTDGEQFAEETLKIRLDDRNRLLITRGLTSLLSVDFDLDASHDVDILPTPAEAVSAPFILAEIDPVDTKDIRVRGRFLQANEAEMYYTIAIRPFHDQNGDFGRAKVNVTDTTEFEVDGEMFTGVEGLRALTAAGQGTLTVAQGTLNVGDREFVADIVLAGSSVPGIDGDAVKGSVLARNGNELTVRGATVFPHGMRPFYYGDVTVTVGPDTKVFKTTHDELLGIDAISVGQNVSIRGDVTVDADSITMDATMGAVRMNVTHLSGIVNTIMTGQVDIELQSIDRKRVSVFDFSGTGITPEQDADPANYEIATGNLLMASDASGQPVVVYGFPTAFGAAPPDFDGRTIIDYSDVRSALGVGWGAEGTAVPFLMADENGLLLDNRNPVIDQRHYIKQGPVLIDLTALDSNTLIVARETGRKAFVIKTTDSLQLYADFDDFVSALANELGMGARARSMFARGLYDSASNTFTAHVIGIHLLEPGT